MKRNSANMHYLIFRMHFKILFLFLFVCEVHAQTSVQMSKLMYEHGEVGEFILQNPERLVFGACHQNQDIHYQIEKKESGSWEKTQFACCTCNTLLPPQYFADSVGKFKINGAFMWQVGEYRVALQEIMGELPRALQRSDTTKRPKRTLLQTIYSPAFFVLPAKLPNYPAVIPQEVNFSYYENSKLVKAVRVPHYFLVHIRFDEKDSLVYQAYLKNLALKPYIRPQSYPPKQVFNNTFQKEFGQELFFIAPQNLPAVRKHLFVGGWLLFKQNNQFALRNRIELVWNEEKKAYTEEFSKWLYAKGYTYYNANNLEQTSKNYPFTHSILEIETDSPEKMVQIAKEFIDTGFFSKVSNLLLAPLELNPKD